MALAAEAPQARRWLAALDDFRNWLQLGLEARETARKSSSRQNGGVGSGEVGISHGAFEAEQLFDPERA
jgi:hypothetical protein